MKLKILISSRNNDKIVINGIIGDTLSEIRMYLKEELEVFKFLDRDFFDIRINEDFGANADKDSYNACLKEVRDSDFFVALYNGAAGWAPPGIPFGICHEELAVGMEISRKKTAIIDISNFFKITPADDDERQRNEAFESFIKTQNRFNNPLKLSKANETTDGFKKELLASVKNVIYNHLKERFKLSNIYFGLGGGNKIALDWKKLKYEERGEKIIQLLDKIIQDSGNFNELVWKSFSIPDNMSVEDARSRAGRPFLFDQQFISDPREIGRKRGPLHFIGIYGKATEIQVKNLIGFPDITVIKEDFGFYVWEQNTHVQLVFLTECRTPEAVTGNFILFNNWCQSSGEFESILRRAEARYYILNAMNEAKGIAVT
jgi:hypothetical protein